MMILEWKVDASLSLHCAELTLLDHIRQHDLWKVATFIKIDEFCIKIDELLFKMMDFALKLMNFYSKWCILYDVWKNTSLWQSMFEVRIKNHEFCIKNDEICIKIDELCI